MGGGTCGVRGAAGERSAQQQKAAPQNHTPQSYIKKGSGMSIENFIKKAGDLAKQHSGKAKEVLQSEQAEGITDKVLDGAADLANKVTDGKHADKIQQARDTADKHLGNE